MKNIFKQLTDLLEQDECLDKNNLYVNLNEIEDRECGVSKEDRGS